MCFLRCTFTIHVAGILFNKKILSRAHTSRFNDYHRKSREGGHFSASLRTLRPTAGHAAQNRSETCNGTLTLPDEMLKDLNVNKHKNVNTKVPHNQSVSTCSDRAIISGHADHYLTAFWCLESNLREARPWLWLTIEEGKRRSKRAFSFTSPQNVNSPTASRPAGAFESSCPRSLRK